MPHEATQCDVTVTHTYQQKCFTMMTD